MKARALILSVLLSGLAAGGAALGAPPPGAAAVSEDIRDIRGPISIPAWWRLAGLAGGGVLVAGLLGGAAVWTRRRREPTAEERALRMLDQARLLAEADKPREYADAASEAVRWYIEQRFGLRAARSTTEEFLAELVAGSAPALAERKEVLRQFLQDCDLAKFARYALPPEGMRTLHELARQFVLTAAGDRTGAPAAPGRLS